MYLDFLSLSCISFISFLYIGVLRYTWKGGIQNKFFGYVCPILACIGALIVIYGGLSSSNGKMYLIVSILSLASGCLILLYKKRKHNLQAFYLQVLFFYGI